MTFINRNLKYFMILVLLKAIAMQAQVITYPESLRTEMPHNDSYTVRVRTLGGSGKTCMNTKYMWIWIKCKRLPWFNLTWEVRWK